MAIRVLEYKQCLASGSGRCGPRTGQAPFLQLASAVVGVDLGLGGLLDSDLFWW